MKIDPYKHKEKYQAWKEKINKIGYIEGISKTNSKIILRYLFDMELGINISNKSSWRVYAITDLGKQVLKLLKKY